MLTRGESKIFLKAKESWWVVGLDFLRNLKNEINASKLKQRSEKMILEKISNRIKISKSYYARFSEFCVMTPTFYFIFQYPIIFYVFSRDYV